MSKLVFKPGEIQHITAVKQVELPAKYQKNLIDTEEYHEFEMDEEGNPIDIYQGPSIEEMEAEKKVSEIEHDAYMKGHEAGREEGYKEGQAEVMRLIDRLGTIVSTAVDIRDDIIKSSEKLMTEMILMIARKVIKDEIVERREIIINNIKEAIKRVKDRDRIDIRVNFADLDMTTAHKDELIKMMESLKKVNIYEDSRVERGGCIIETDVGAIDARISTQLDAIEEAIRNTSTL